MLVCVHFFKQISFQFSLLNPGHVTVRQQPSPHDPAWLPDPRPDLGAPIHNAARHEWSPSRGQAGFLWASNEWYGHVNVTPSSSIMASRSRWGIQPTSEIKRKVAIEPTPRFPSLDSRGASFLPIPRFQALFKPGLVTPPVNLTFSPRLILTYRPLTCPQSFCPPWCLA